MDQNSIAECISSLKSDRLITLNIGKVEAFFSVQVQQAVLEAASPWFQKALRNDRFTEGQSGVINFLEDDAASWEILLYWLLHHNIPRRVGADRVVHFVSRAKCWVLGDKYGMPGFQDQAMFQLLECAHAFDFRLQPAQYQELIMIAPADSVLMRLIAEEAAWQYKDGFTKHSDATIMDVSTGFWPVFLTVQHKIKEDISYVGSRLQSLDHCNEEEAHWREYMVGELPDALMYVEP